MSEFSETAKEFCERGPQLHERGDLAGAEAAWREAAELDTRGGEPAREAAFCLGTARRSG